MIVVTPAGDPIDLGTVEETPTIGIIDYSRRVTDDYGVTTVVPRGFARRMSVRLAVPSDAVDALQRTLADLRAVAATWIADARFQSLTVRGFFKDFSIDIANGSISYCTLTVEGLTVTEPITNTGADPAPEGKASTMRLLDPNVMTDAALIEASVPETDHPEWAAGTGYGMGARVIKVATHRVYESTIDANIGNDPAAVGSSQWLDVGPTNRWAAFDQALGTATTSSSQIAYTIDGQIAAVALLDVSGDTVRVTADGYDRTQPAGPGAVTFLDLPAGTTRVTVALTGEQVAVGTLLVGRLVGLGVTEASPSAGLTDYSRKETDDFGDVTVVERAWAKRMSARALLRTGAIDDVVARLAGVRARPVLWLGREGQDSLTVYGFFKDFSIEVGQTVSKLSLAIEGLSKATPVEPLTVPWPNITDPDGTKPDDGATVGAPPGTPVGSRPAEDVDQEARSTSVSHLMSMADQELARIRSRALIFPSPDGADVYTISRRETAARKATDEAQAEVFDLLGAVAANGRSFVLNASTVLVEKGGAGSTQLVQIGARFEDAEAEIQDVKQVFAGPNGSTIASASLLVTADGRMLGYRALNNGVTGSFTFTADRFTIETPDGKRLFYADETGVKMHSVEVDTLAVGAMDPEFLENLDPFDGNEGSQRLPGGLMMKWGRFRAPLDDEVQLSIVFDTPFPVGCDSFVPTPFVQTFSDVRDLWLQLVGNPTRFGATVGTQAATKNEQRLDGFDWLAFGR